MRQKEREAAEALERLREWVKPGDTIWCVLRSVSRSGMMRVIDFQKFEADGRHLSLGWNIAKALDMGYDRNREGVKVTGCGMDMGFHVVSNLGYALYPQGFGCIGRTEDRQTWCPSNDHSNGDRDYTPHGTCDLCREPDCKQDKPHLQVKHWHTSGGYALVSKWV